MPETSQTLPLYNVNRWFPSDFNRGPNWVVWLGLLASFTAVFIKLWTPTSINRIPEALYTLPFFYILIVNFRWLKNDRIIQLFGLAIMLPILFHGINYIRDPALATELEGLDKLVKLFFFVPIAWWLGGKFRTTVVFLLFAFFGLLVAMAVNSDLAHQWSLIKRGIRVDYGILNAQHVGQFFGIALIGFLTLGTYCRKLNTPKAKLGLATAVLTGALISLLVVLTTQTRAALLALALCGALAYLIYSIALLRKPAHWATKATVLTIPLLAILITLPFMDSVTKRIQQEQTTLTAIAAGDWNNIPASSLGVRVNTAIVAMEWISERPFIGWGGDVNGYAINNSDRLSNSIKNRFGHFHNTLIEFTLAYGVLGLLVLLTLYLTLAKQAYLLRISSNPAFQATAQFTLYTLLFFAVINQFESYLFYYSGVFANSVAFAPLYSLILARASTQSSAAS